MTNTLYLPGRLPALLLIACLSGFKLVAQPAIAWDKTLGGSVYEELQALLPLPDGMIIAGSSHSNASFGQPNDFFWNFLIYKVDTQGQELWRKVYGGFFDERLWSMIPCSDGGFLAGGYSESDISGNKTETSRGGRDYWIAKLDAQGNLEWDKTFGGPGHDELFSMVQLSDGTYLLGGYSNSDAGGDKSENSRGSFDFWLVCCNPQGQKLWDKTLGGDAVDLLNDIRPAGQGRVFLSGGTNSPALSGDWGADMAQGGMDYCLLLFDPKAREVLWQHRYGGSGEDFAYAVSKDGQGNIWLGGHSSSQPTASGAGPNGKSSPYLGGISDYWLLKLQNDGAKIQDWSYGGDAQDGLYDLVAYECGDVLIGGVSASGISGNKTTALRGGVDYWLLELDNNGQLRRQQSYGGAGDDAMSVMASFPNGAIAFGGHSSSGAGFEKTEAAIGANDFWVLSTGCDVGVKINAGEQVRCDADPLDLSAATNPDCPGCLFQWNTGEQAPAIQAPAGVSDTFRLRACDPMHCVAYDSLFVERDAVPTIDIGPADTLIFEGNVLSLGAEIPGLAYQWSTGEVTPVIMVGESGFYSVTVSNSDACTASDAIQVLVKRSNGTYVPNIFSPDGDGKNDVLEIYANENVALILRFQVYDRWGDLVFDRFNYAPGAAQGQWDGRIGGKTAAAGVYVWLAKIQYGDGGMETIKGDVTIVR